MLDVVKPKKQEIKKPAVPIVHKQEEDSGAQKEKAEQEIKEPVVEKNKIKEVEQASVAPPTK